MSSLYPNGLKGLADTLWSGAAGSAHKIVGIDFRSKPGIMRVHQKLAKHSASTIDELCKHKIAASDGSNLWFSFESGKIWREVAGVYTLVHTTVSAVPKIIDENDPSTTGSVSFSASITRIGQSFTGNGGTLMRATANLKLLSGTPVGNIVAKIYAHTGTFGSTGTPTGAALATSGNYDTAGLTGSYQTINFNFTGGDQIALNDGTRYFLSIEYTPDAAEVVQMEPGSGHPGNSATYNPGGGGTWSASGTDMKFSIGVIPPVLCLGAEEHDGYVYWATETALHRKQVLQSGYYEVLNDWSDAEQDFGTFDIGDDENHPMVVQNLELFIGDKTIIAKVNTVGTFESATEFNIKAPEQIVTLAPFDIDILVGTRAPYTGRALRWDGSSESWGSEDIVEGGVNAFIRDDNYVYASCGDYGRLYFYDGEKLVPYLRIPGDWSPTKRAKVHQSAVAFHMNVPLFGLSNVEGNPAEQGVYGFGSYSKDYPKTLALDFPLPTGDFVGITVGAIIVRGADIYVSYKNASDVGVAKLDWAAKYTAAYIETVALTAPKERSRFKTASRFYADYIAMPASCDIDFSYKRAYDASFTPLESINDPDLLQKVCKESIPKIASLLLRFDFTVNVNDTPEIENIGCEINAGES